MDNDTQASPRLFAEDLATGVVTIAGGEAHHAARVLRLRAGDAVELFDGRGRASGGRIEAVARRQVRVAIDDAPREQPRPAPAVELAFAVPKSKRLDWLLEKATELGAAALQPIVFARSVAGPGAGEMSAAKRERWRLHCVAACKQCGLNWLPALAEPAELTAYLGVLPPAGDNEVRVVGETGSAPPVREALSAPPACGVLTAAPRCERAVILVGPEGGLTTDERQAAAAAGFQAARLGETTLRVETADVALIAAVRAVFGR